jgi:hypothetical protein
MLTEKNILLSLVENFLDNNCDNTYLEEIGKRSFKSYLKRDEFNCFAIFDNECSIKCVFDKDFLKNYLALLPSYIKLDSLEGI